MSIKHWYGIIPVLITFHSTDLTLALSYCLILVPGHVRKFIYSRPVVHQFSMKSDLSVALLTFYHNS